MLGLQGNDMTNEQLYMLLGAQAFNMLVVLWMINRTEQSINRRIDDLKELLKSEIKRLEDKIIGARIV